MDLKKLLKIFEAGDPEINRTSVYKGDTGPGNPERGTKFPKTYYSGNPVKGRADYYYVDKNKVGYDSSGNPAFPQARTAKPAIRPNPNPNQDIIDQDNRNRDAQQAVVRGDEPTDRFKGQADTDAASGETHLQGTGTAPADATVASDTPNSSAAPFNIQPQTNIPGSPTAPVTAAPAPAPSTQPAASNTVKSGTPGQTWNTGSGGKLTTDTDDVIAQRGPMGTTKPTAADRAQGDKNLQSLKNLFGVGSKPEPTPAAPSSTAPDTSTAAGAMASKSAQATAPNTFAEEELEEELNEIMRLSGQPMQEKAPPTAKGERMVKHIKKGYAKDGKLTDKEKSIAYATAWKSHNKSKVSESVMLEAGSTLEHIIKKFKHETKNFLAGNDLDNDLYDALYDYYSDNGEMPYGVAKARDGDPYQWISNKFADEMQMHGYGRQADMLNMPGADHELTELARLAGLSESQVAECGDMDTEQQDSMNVSTNMSSDGTKSVSISAQGDQADALLQMLKMAGMRPHDNDNSMGMTEPEVIMVSSAPHDNMHDEEMMDEEYANEPEEEYQTIDSIIHQGNDLNREKRQYADKPKLGDNPMAEEMSLDEELASLLDSILVREEMTDVLKAEQPYKDEKTGKMVTPPKGATMPPADSPPATKTAAPTVKK